MKKVLLLVAMIAMSLSFAPTAKASQNYKLLDDPQIKKYLDDDNINLGCRKDSGFWQGFKKKGCCQAQVVAYYPDGLHGIVAQSGITHEGEDIVIKLCNGNFIQIFKGRSDTEGLHIHISKWVPANCYGRCPKGAVLVPSAFPEWGDYLAPNTNYCVSDKIIRVDQKNHCEKRNHCDKDNRFEKPSDNWWRTR